MHGRECYLIHGVWSDEEVSLLHITVLEAVTTLMSLPPFQQAAPSITHVLEFTDNTGAEWSFRRETPHAPLLQLVTQRRVQYLRDANLFSRIERVTSAGNSWADDLSRQRVAKVVAEATALDFTVHMLQPCPILRDTLYLRAAAKASRSA